MRFELARLIGDGESDADHRAIAEWDQDAAADEFFAFE